MGNSVVRTMEDKFSQGDVDDLKEVTKFTSKEIWDWYRIFKKDFPTGVIDKDDFVQMYCKMLNKGDAATFAEHVFRAYDADGNGHVDFQEFMTTLSIASKGSIDEKLHWAYSMYDMNGDGQVSRKEAIEIVHSIFKMRGEKDDEKADEAVDHLFSNLDKDCNENLSENEFVQGAKRSPTICELLRGQ